MNLTSFKFVNEDKSKMNSNKFSIERFALDLSYPTDLTFLHSSLFSNKIRKILNLDSKDTMFLFLHADEVSYDRKVRGFFPKLKNTCLDVL